GPDETFAKCARCMAAGEPHLDLPHTRLIGLAKKGLYYSGIRPLFPNFLAPRLPRYFDRHGWRRRDEAIRRQLRTCRAVITFSDIHGRVLRELLGLPASLFRTLHYPSREPAPSYRPSPERFRPPLRFAWVHRLGREWGPQLLLEAWRRAALAPAQAQLYMYAGMRNKGGAADWVRSAGYGDLMDRGSLVVTEERVHLREDEVYGKVSAYVATPLWKLNAYSADPLGYGFPMIFPRGTALEEIHVDGLNAFAYTQGDPQSLADVLRRVAADPRLLAEASRNSVFPRDRSPEACGDALLAIYREVLDAAGASGRPVP
ncbi:MAG TPA: hypothetical protein VFK70_17005, partial [Vicinamibacteria bacterium]|nr:hypothetical protein [Vicinamibacteria bacterium]